MTCRGHRQEFGYSLNHRENNCMKYIHRPSISSTQSISSFMISDSFTIIAHRGAAWTEPENSLRAFRHGEKLGCKWIECDDRKTKFSVPVIIHDAMLNRTTG